MSREKSLVVPRSCLLAAIILATVAVERSAAYKAVRPYKYYRPKPRWGPPRWHPSSSSSSSSSTDFARLHRPRKIPHCAATRHRYAPLYDDPPGKEPYTIVIQLPKGDVRERERWSYRRGSSGDDIYRAYRRGAAEEEVDVDSENAQDDVAEDGSYARSLRVGGKSLRVKVVKGARPKVHIQISRSDEGHDGAGLRGRGENGASGESGESGWTPIVPLARKDSA